MEAMIARSRRPTTHAEMRLTKVEPESIEDEMLTGLPANIVAHIRENGAMIHRFSSDYVFKPKTQMLVDRANAIIDGFCYLNRINESKSENWKEINSFRDEIISNIRSRFNLDEIDLQTPKTRKQNLKQLERILKQYDDYLVKDVINRLLPVTRDEEENLANLERLRQAEIDYQSTKGRPVMINVDAHNGHARITCELPYVIAANGEPITQASYKRDNNNLSNSVWRIHANMDTSTGEIALESDLLRGASSVPIDISDEIDRTKKTIDIIRQDIQAIVERKFASAADDALVSNSQKKPFMVNFDQLSLLSMLWKRLAKYDEQQGLLQVITIFHAFNLINSQGSYLVDVTIHGNKELIWIKPELTLLNIGVNTGRFITDPMQGWLNRMAFNRMLPNIANAICRLDKDQVISDKNPHAKALLKLVMNIFLHSQQKEPLQKAKDNWETEIQERYDQLNRLLENPNLDNHEADLVTFNDTLRQIESSLGLHHEHFETPVYKAQQKLWRKQRKLFKRQLDYLHQELTEKIWLATDDNTKRLIEFYHYMQDLYTVLDLLFERKYLFIKKHNLKKYNYLLNNALIRLLQRLGHEIKVHCNDGEDRTGKECLALKSAEEFLRIQGHYPRHWVHDDFNELNRIESELQHTDVGIQNTEHNVPGAVGFEVHGRDVSSNMLKEAKFMAQRAKAPYRKAKKFIKRKVKAQAAKEPLTTPRHEPLSTRAKAWYIVKNILIAALVSLSCGLIAPTVSANVDRDVVATPTPMTPDSTSTQPFDRRDDMGGATDDRRFKHKPGLGGGSNGKRHRIGFARTDAEHEGKGKEPIDKIDKKVHSTSSPGKSRHSVFAKERVDKPPSSVPGVRKNVVTKVRPNTGNVSTTSHPYSSGRGKRVTTGPN